ncbi:DUF3138 family protein [Rubrivivax gelatinosus]|uniref:DUF3138 family protein n=1 Tax=Rubrivivax gelatinosus TaxID=28068 RepID=UPI003A7F7D4A
MKPVRLTALVIAIGAAFPAAAQSNEELLKELRALRDRVGELEKKLAAQPAAAPAPQPGQWGMTPEQAQELARIGTKAEALQDNFEMQGFKGLKISGQINPTWIYNRRADDASFVLLNGEDARYTYDNSYFGMAVLDFLKETEGGTIWHLTLAPERGTGALTNGGSIVHEASVSVPLNDLQTRLWVGQIPDWTGYEITLPAGNKLITHNLLFDFMAPTAYTGAVLDHTSGKWWSRIGLANFNTPRNGSGNKRPVLIYRVDYSKGEFSGWGFTGLHGKGYNYAADDTDDAGNALFPNDVGRNTQVHLLEIDGYFVRGDWSLFGQASYGQQKKAAIYRDDGTLRNARWWGLSGTAAYMITPRLEAVLRADYVNNEKNGGGLLGYSWDDGANGIGRGFGSDGSYSDGADKGANRYALSVGANYRYDENTLFKLEYRFDAASQPVFEDVKDGGYAKNNHLLGASVVVSF